MQLNNLGVGEYLYKGSALSLSSAPLPITILQDNNTEYTTPINVNKTRIFLKPILVVPNLQ